MDADQMDRLAMSIHLLMKAEEDLSFKDAITALAHYMITACEAVCVTEEDFHKIMDSIKQSYTKIINDRHL